MFIKIFLANLMTFICDIKIDIIMCEPHCVNFLVVPSKRSNLSGHYGVCMYVCRDVVLLDNCLTEKSITLLDNCLTEKSITYSHTQRNFF